MVITYIRNPTKHEDHFWAYSYAYPLAPYDSVFIVPGTIDPVTLEVIGNDGPLF